jgi:deoxyribodipyrimidine photo-lyase
VASTFSHKPYFFNRANLERYTGGRFRGSCPARSSCPFEGSYEELSQRLFRLQEKE